jgi:hypothetical protein
LLVLKPELNSDDTVEDCSIQKESCIHVVQRAIGQVAPTGQRNGNLTLPVEVLKMTLDVVAAVTKKIYDIKVTENKDPDSATLPRGDVESPPGYDQEKHELEVPQASAQIFIKSLDGKSTLLKIWEVILAVTLNIDDFGMSVKELKAKFYEKEGLEVKYQSLVYAGKPLRDGMKNCKGRVTDLREMSKGL